MHTFLSTVGNSLMSTGMFFVPAFIIWSVGHELILNKSLKFKTIKQKDKMREVGLNKEIYDVMTTLVKHKKTGRLRYRYEFFDEMDYDTYGRLSFKPEIREYKAIDELALKHMNKAEKDAYELVVNNTRPSVEIIVNLLDTAETLTRDKHDDQTRTRLRELYDSLDTDDEITKRLKSHLERLENDKKQSAKDLQDLQLENAEIVEKIKVRE